MAMIAPIAQIITIIQNRLWIIPIISWIDLICPICPATFPVPHVGLDCGIFLTTGPFARAAAPSIARAPCLIDLARDQCLHLISGLFGFKDQRFDAAHMLIAISMRHEDIGVFGGDIIIIAAAL